MTHVTSQEFKIHQVAHAQMDKLILKESVKIVATNVKLVKEQLIHVLLAQKDLTEA